MTLTQLIPAGGAEYAPFSGAAARVSSFAFGAPSDDGDDDEEAAVALPVDQESRQVSSQSILPEFLVALQSLARRDSSWCGGRRKQESRRDVAADSVGVSCHKIRTRSIAACAVDKVRC
mgnify:FL=1